MILVPQGTRDSLEHTGANVTSTSPPGHIRSQRFYISLGQWGKTG